jgi:hypothetical protein
MQSQPLSCKPDTESSAWRIWSLFACLLLLVLLQALSDRSAGVQELPLSKVERDWSSEPALLAAQDSRWQVRRDVVSRLDERTDDALDLLYALSPLPVISSAGFLSCAALARRFLLPVLAQPGAPRGPPAGP